MKVGIDITNYVEGRAIGYNTYILNLLKGFSLLQDIETNNLVFFVRDDHASFFAKLFPRLIFRPIKISNFFGKLLWQNFVLPFYGTYQVYLFTANFAPIFLNKRYLIVIHDLNFLKFPKNFSFISRCYRYFLIKRFINKASVVIVDSNVIAEEVFKYTKSSSEVIYVPVPGVKISNSTDTDKHKFESDKIKILVPSSIGEHKNITNAYLACLNIVKASQNIEVTFIGNWQPNFFLVDERHSNIKLLGFVEFEKKADLFLNSNIVLYPSLYEGFGLPYIEAIAAQKILICSDIPIAREMAESYPIYIQAPFESREIEVAIKKAISNIGTSNANSSLGLLERFSPHKIALEYYEVIKNAK